MGIYTWCCLPFVFETFQKKMQKQLIVVFVVLALIVSEVFGQGRKDKEDNKTDKANKKADKEAAKADKKADKESAKGRFKDNMNFCQNDDSCGFGMECCLRKRCAPIGQCPRGLLRRDF